MTAAAETGRRIEAGRLMAIIRRRGVEPAVDAVLSLHRSGVGAIELSLAVPGALAALGAAVKQAPPDTLIGAGTVLDAESASAAIDAGARFLVSPSLAPGAAEVARANGVLHIPGVMTPTELATALETDAPLIKLFPAARFGADYVRDLLAPFPAARLVATGGIDEANALDFLSAGAAVVAIGGALDRIAEPRELESAARRLVRLASNGKGDA